MKFKYRQKTFDIDGISQEDAIYRTIVQTRCFYEIDLLEYMYSIRHYFRKENGTAVDVGANIGNHSIFMQSFLTANLISIEPNPKVLAILHRNLKQNINNYSIYDCAVGETAGMGSIFLPDGAKNNVGMAKIDLDGHDNNITITTLDAIVERWNTTHNMDSNISIIKIDVEGMEMAALKGAKNTIQKHKPHLFIEAATIEEFGEVNSYLRSLGYKVLSRWAVTPVYHFSYSPSKRLIFAVRLAKYSHFPRSIKKIIMGEIKYLAKRRNVNSTALRSNK